MNFKKIAAKMIVAFTLAEVLITLGIIGIVAEITIPTLYNGFLKQTTVTRLQGAYSTLYQAIKLSQQENGDISTWNYGTTKDGASTLNWFKTYLAPYMKYTSTSLSTTLLTNDSASIYLVDGTIVQFWNSSGVQVHAYVYLNGMDHAIGGKNMFTFLIGATSAVSNDKNIRPYDYPLTTITSRNDWISDSTYGCSKTASNAYKPHCAGLIMYDNWQIKSDYPYFN